MRLCFILIGLLIGWSTAAAQMPFSDHEQLQSAPQVRRAGLPVVSFDYQNQFLMRAFYPEYYQTEQQIARDVRWVTRNDSAFKALWQEWGDSILALIEDYSGFNWIETNIDLHVVKYAPRDGMYDPLVIPLEGIKKRHYIEAVPTGWHELLNLIKIFAGRNLLQTDRPGKTRHYLADHPLMQKTAYRFDVMTLAVTMACAEQIIPLDSLEIITDSHLWQRYNPGWALYQAEFRYNWILQPQSPLAVYLTDEPYSSSLVIRTRPPRINKQESETEETTEPVHLGAGGGRLGFSVIKNQKKLLEVVDIDTTSLAYSSGLRLGDQIKRVNGEYARHARDLMGKILDKLDTDGVYMIVVRDEEETGILLVPPVEGYHPIEEF